MRQNKQRARWTSASPTIMTAAAIALTLGIAGAAGAVEIPTDNPDLTVRFDNTLKYTAALRVSKESSTVAGGPNTSDGDNAFKPGDLTSNRVDILTEFDLDYQHRMGFRVSAAGWYDAVYAYGKNDNRTGSSTNLGFTSQTIPTGTQVLQGRDAEFLDAFVYRNFSLDNGQNLNVRVGRHSLLWGETLFWGGNGIAGTQQPVDVVKASALPGAQFKEIIMPVGQVSALWQLSPKLSFGAFYQFEDRKERDPTVGSYFGFADFYAAGGNNLILGSSPIGPVYVNRTKNVDAYEHNQGGVELRFKASDNWELGAYFVNFDARSPQFYLTPTGGIGPNREGVNIGTYRAVYAQDIQAYGASVATLVDDTNVSAEFSVRSNQPLAGNPGGFMTDLTGQANVSDHILYPVGKTFHGNMSAITLFPANPLWQGAALVGEIAYNYRISNDNHLALDPNTTASAWAAWMNFEPSYFQVLPGLDLTLPINVTYVFGGRSSLGPSIFNFIGENCGSVTFGVSGLYQDRYKFSLQYTDFFGPTAPFAVGDPTTVPAGPYYSYKQQYGDRNYVALTLSTSF